MKRKYVIIVENFLEILRLNFEIVSGWFWEIKKKKKTEWTEIFLPIILVNFLY